MAEGFSPPWASGGFAPGTRIASYELAELIGRGGMAVVYRARDDRLNRQVALKILDPALAADEAFRQRFIRESRTAASVDDPNIIPVYEAGEADGVLFIAMRLVRGGNLRSLVAHSGQLPPGRTAQIIAAVASALDAAHGAGLVHRDVKPGNILLETRQGRPDHVYLSDFGLSKAALGGSGLTGTGMFLGTVDYAAPEQIQGLQVDGRTDQYALGCTAFELLCGRPPFVRDQGLAAIYAHLSEPPPPATAIRPTLPAAVDAVLARVLAKSPAERYATCQEFSDALSGALEVASTGAVAAQQRQRTELAMPIPGAPVTTPPSDFGEASGQSGPSAPSGSLAPAAQVGSQETQRWDPNAAEPAAEAEERPTPPKPDVAVPALAALFEASQAAEPEQQTAKRRRPGRRGTEPGPSLAKSAGSGAELPESGASAAAGAGQPAVAGDSATAEQAAGASAAGAAEAGAAEAGATATVAAGAGRAADAGFGAAGAVGGASSESAGGGPGLSVPGQGSPPAVSVPGHVPHVGGDVLAATGALKGAENTVHRQIPVPLSAAATMAAADAPAASGPQAGGASGWQEAEPQVNLDKPSHPETAQALRPVGGSPSQPGGHGQPGQAQQQPGGQPPYQPYQAAGQPPYQPGGQAPFQAGGQPPYQPGGQPYQQPGQPYQPGQAGQPYQPGGQAPYQQPGQPYQQPGQPYQPGQPPFQPGQPGQPPFQYEQQQRGRKRPLIWGAVVAVVVLAGAAVGVYLLHKGSTASSGSTTVSSSFSHQYGGVKISELWKLSGQGQSTLSVRITASNSASSAVAIKLSEPIPTSVASNLQGIAYSPRPVSIVTADRLVAWELSLPPNGSAVVGYKMQLTKPATKAALNQLIAGFNAIQSKESVAVIPPMVTSLTVTPATVKLTVGHSATVKLSGTRSDGSSATAAVLKSAVWKTSNSRVATVSNGKITAKGPGTARITAQIGSVTATVVVTVSRPQPTYVPPPTYTQPYTPPPTTNPAPAPSGTPTPTV